MKYVITSYPPIEDILLGKFRSYLYEDVRFAQLYPNFGNVNVSLVHPFAYLNDQKINGTQVPVELFPSVTIISNTDNQAVEVPSFTESFQLTTEKLNLVKNDRDTYIVSDQAVSDLETAIGAGDVFGQGGGTRKRDEIALEVWAENIELKNKLYDLVMAFLTSPYRYELKSDHEIDILIHTINGTRGGNYNFEFGRILFGGMIQFNADYPIALYVIDAELGAFSAVEHTYQEVHYGED